MKGIKLKINRAGENLEELGNEIKSFIQKNPYEVGHQQLPDGKIDYRMSRVDPIPDCLNLLVGEVLQNLRTALDHMVVQIYLKNRPGTNIRNISFPIKENKSKFDAWALKAHIDFSQDVINQIGSIKPYGSGNDLLCQLNDLNNIDKHRMIVTAGGVFAGVDVFQYLMSEFKKHPEFQNANFNESLIIREDKIDFPFTVGQLLFTDGVSGQPSNDWKFHFKIVIYEPGVVEGADVLIILKSMLEEVKRIENILSPYF